MDPHLARRLRRYTSVPRPNAPASSPLIGRLVDRSDILGPSSGDSDRFS